MKLKIAVLSFVTVAIFSNVAMAAQQKDQDNDACKKVMCLVGKIKGEDGGDDCDKPIKEYFSIIVTKKGKFSPSRTAAERQRELEKCANDISGSVDKVSQKFGRLRGL